MSKTIPPIEPEILARLFAIVAEMEQFEGLEWKKDADVQELAAGCGGKVIAVADIYGERVLPDENNRCSGCYVILQDGEGRLWFVDSDSCIQPEFRQ